MNDTPLPSVPKNDLLLRAARRERTSRTPVWLMRQAGRTDPEYVRLRERCGLPLHDMFRHADLATEVSLLPRRMGVDALIFFQDILTPLAPLGAPFEFVPGPVFAEPIRSASQVQRLQFYDIADELPFVGRILQNLRREAGAELPILGFAGAPLTLAFFMIEGQSPGSDPTVARRFMHEQPQLLHRLLEKLSRLTVDYLNYQIASGAHAVQLFESCADLLTPDEYREFAHPYQQQIFATMRQDVPRILFAKEQPDVGLMIQTGAEVISVGNCVDLATARHQFGDRVALQGNVDNQLLVAGPLEAIDRAVSVCITAGDHTGHILNLNHGLLRNTPYDHILQLIHSCRQTIVNR
ncbi:MAG: Uroporphyrinogen decarboxylase [Phycisphaerae bacterium]|nr:Uroporphyrinogen decarboxylase [Phycisphaerae bacterium]